jgi:diguanylate cyclase (GGDEF)-like protein
VLQKRVERELARIGRLNSELKKKQEALQSANQRLNQLATLDGLTGLHNHRHFQEMLDHFYARAEALHEPISVILLDVDHFKQYNDQFGHPAGDQVLRQVGKIVQRRTRDTDLAARYGGEEFVLILPATGKEGALRTAEKIRASLESADWPLRAVTASFGVATLRPGIEGPSALVDLADKALYESKRGGRNRVTHADSVSACQGAAA